MDLGGILDLVNGGATAVDGVIKAIKGAKELTKKPETTGGIDARALNERLSEALDEMLRVKEQRLALYDAIQTFQAERSSFEKEKAKFQDFATKIPDYVLQTIAPNSFAYTLKPGIRPEEPRHYACVPCFQKQKLSVLQLEKRDFNFDTLRCPECGTAVSCENDVRAEVRTVPRNRSGIWGDGWLDIP